MILLHLSYVLQCFPPFVTKVIKIWENGHRSWSSSPAGMHAMGFLRSWCLLHLQFKSVAQRPPCWSKIWIRRTKRIGCLVLLLPIFQGDGKADAGITIKNSTKQVQSKIGALILSKMMLLGKEEPKNIRCFECLRTFLSILLVPFHQRRGRNQESWDVGRNNFVYVIFLVKFKSDEQEQV